MSTRSRREMLYCVSPRKKNSTQGGELLLDRVISYAFIIPKDSRTVIPNLGYTYPQWYEPGHLGVCEKKKIEWWGEKGTYVNSVRQDKFEITETILITNILLIWRVQFVEIGSEGVRKWKRFGNHCSRTWNSNLNVQNTCDVFCWRNVEY